jgi:hypothetical protein
MKSLGRTISTGLTLPIIAFGAASVKAFDEQIKAETKLRTALGDSAEAFDVLKKQAQDLQKITIFGDEATLEAQSFLAQLGLNADAILRLTPLIQDFATAQGIQLTDAAKLVAKSVGSSTNALSRYGLQIEGTVGEQDRLESAVNALSKAFGGQSEAIAKEGLGPLQQLKNELGDVSEKFGEIVLEFIDPLTKGLEKISDALSSLTKEQKENIVQYGAILAAVGPVLILFGSLVTTISTLIPLFTAIAGAVSLSAAPFIAIAAAVGYFIKRIVDLQNEYEEYNEVVGDFEPIAPFVPTPTTPTTPAIQRSTIPERIEPIKALGVELDKIPKKLKKIDENFESSFDNVETYFDRLSRISESIGRVLMAGAENFKDFAEQVKSAARSAIGALLAEGVAAAVSSALKNPAIALNPALIPVIAGVAGGLAKTAFNSLVPAFADGGIVSGPTIGLMGEYAGARTNPEVIAPLDKLKSMIGTNGGSTEVFGVISGADILLSSDRAKANRNRTRGY